MSSKSVALRDLIRETRDGDWGKDEPGDRLIPYRVIRGGDFPNVERGDVEKVPRCYLKASTVHRRTLRVGDLLIETAGGTKDCSTGRVLYISKEVLAQFDLPVTCASFARFVRLNEDKVNPKFLFWYLRSMHERGEMWQHQVQHTGVARFQWSNFADTCEIELPPRYEQDRVVEILDSLSEKIVLNRQINHALEQTAQAIFRSWFVDFGPVKAKKEASAAGRDPERAAMCAISGKTDDGLDQLPAAQRQQLAATAALFPAELVESELGLIPKGWSLVSLYDSATFINGAAFNTKDFSLKQEGLPIVKIAELKSGISDQTKFTESTFPQKYRIDNHDVLYSWSGSPNTSLEVFKWFGGKGWLNQHIFKVVTKTSAAKYFVFYLLRLLKPRLIAIATDKQTTGLGHVTVADMKRLKIAYPDKAILNDFERIVGPLYEEGSQIEIQSCTLRNVRDGLLPVLLSGEPANVTATVSTRDVK